MAYKRRQDAEAKAALKELAVLSRNMKLDAQI
jgi:hypothetical protein